MVDTFSSALSPTIQTKHQNMKFELIFVPYPVLGHLRSTVEMAKLLVDREPRLSISVIILPLLSVDDISASAYIAALSATPHDRLRYEVISSEDQPIVKLHIENHMAKVRSVVAKLVDDYSKDSTRLAGLVVDMFCTSVIKVANEFNVPCYLFYTSNVGILALGLHIQMLYDKKEYKATETDFEDSEVMLKAPSLTLPYPVKCLPYGFGSKEWLPMFVNQTREFRKMKGILVNSFAELESYALECLLSSGDIPRAYPVGPILHLENNVGSSKDEKGSEILRWLDEQPPRSVVFLCFGSIGGFREEQAREIAIALERSGQRFLWSLRRATPDIDKELPGEFKNLEGILQEGFFDRTKGRGKVIGWAPQVAVLAKPAIGGFVTHGGWNSILESLWSGVPMVPWPLYAEQKFNAFMMVDELGLAVGIKKYWRGDMLVGAVTVIVTAEEIERGIKCLMKQDSDVRKRVMEMSEKCHVALMDGGSSQSALGMFIQDVMNNISQE